MKAMIQSILERELKKLEDRSRASDQPLDSQFIKCLDTLIKAHASFVEPLPPISSSSDPPPNLQSTEALLEDLINDETKT